MRAKRMIAWALAAAALGAASGCGVRVRPKGGGHGVYRGRADDYHNRKQRCDQ